MEMTDWRTHLLVAFLVVALAGLTGLGLLLGQTLAAPRASPTLAPAVVLTVPARAPTPTALPLPTRASALAPPPLPTTTLPSPTAAANGAAGDGRDAIRSATRGVVQVRVGGNFGTGFLAGRRGDEVLVVTNAHVLGARGNSAITVVGPDGTERPAHPLRADIEVDLAVLAVPGFAQAEPLQLRDPAALRPGDSLYVIGYALGTDLLGDPSVTRGVLSGRRQIGTVDYIQTDAAMNPGNSGGPVIDVTGHVVGVAVSGIRDRGGTPIQGINFAIPAGAVREILSQASA
jgi:S1-C subfamily serine protease